MSAWAKNSTDKLAATQSKGLSHQPLVVQKLDVLFPKRERVFHRGIQTPRNK